MPPVRRWSEWKSREDRNSLTEDEVDLHGNVGISKFNCWSARRKVAIAVHAGNGGFVRYAVIYRTRTECPLSAHFVSIHPSDKTDLTDRTPSVWVTDQGFVSFVRGL